MPFITIHDTQYQYLAAGAGQPMLLLHGFTGSSQSWAEVMSLLSARYRVIAVDLPGHGLTQAPDDVTQFTMPIVSQHIASFIASVVGGPAYVLGYSMGGRLALHVALEFPALVKRLTLESASPGLAHADERAARVAGDEALAERIERDGIAAFVAEWERLPMWASQQAVPAAKRARLREQRLHNNPHGLALSLRGMGTGAQPSLWHRLSELRMPVQLLAGELDAKFAGIAKHMAMQIPHSPLCILPQAGHATHFEQPQAFVAAVD